MARLSEDGERRGGAWRGVRCAWAAAGGRPADGVVGLYQFRREGRLRVPGVRTGGRAMSGALPLAGRGRRLAATCIDMVLVPVVAILLMLVTGVLEHAADWSEHGMPFLRMFLLGLASYVLLNLWPLWARGQTVGKALLGIAVVRAGTDERTALWRLVVRGLFFPTLYLNKTKPNQTQNPQKNQKHKNHKNQRTVHD